MSTGIVHTLSIFDQDDAGLGPSKLLGVSCEVQRYFAPRGHKSRRGDKAPGLALLGEVRDCTRSNQGIP